MPAPPLVWLALRIAGGRVLPLLLTAQRRQVEKRPHAAERLGAAVRREVRAEHLVAVAEKHAQAERLPILVDARLRRLRGTAEADVEVALERRVPRDLPPHAFPVRLDLLDRRTGDGGERGVARMQVREM